jgi:hypothetical protein
MATTRGRLAKGDAPGHRDPITIKNRGAKVPLLLRLGACICMTGSRSRLRKPDSHVPRGIGPASAKIKSWITV